MLVQDLSRRIEVARAVAERNSGRGLLDYLGHVIVNSVPEPRRFSEVAGDWQWQIAQTYAPRLDWVAGLRDSPGDVPESFWFTLPRGHDKTGAIGRAVNFLLRFSKRHLEMAVAASDKEQAGIILNSMKLERNLNGFLDPLDFDKWEVTGPGGRMRVFSADAPSAQGETLDFVIFDEITAWKKPDLYYILLSGREKRPGSPLVIITNAGEKKTWQWDQRIIAANSPNWFLWESPERTHLAQWMSEAKVRELRAMLPPAMAARLYDNRWTDPGEENGWVSYAEALACQDHSILPVFKPDSRWRYFAGIDYGPKRDRTVLTIVHREGDNELFVDHMTVWQGRPDAPVQVKAVEGWIDSVAVGIFHADLVVDPYQMASVIQKYEHINRVVPFDSRGGKANYDLAQNLRSLVVNRRLHFPAGCGSLQLESGQIETLVDELSEVVAYPTSYGYRIDTPTKLTKDRRTVHDDRAISLGMAALEAMGDFTAGENLPAKKLVESRPQVTAAQRARLALDRGDGWGLFGGANIGATDWRESL